MQKEPAVAEHRRHPMAGAAQAARALEFGKGLFEKKLTVRNGSVESARRC